MGSTLEACTLDLGHWDSTAPREAQLSGYMCLSRVRKAEDLCIAQPFSPNLFTNSCTQQLLVTTECQVAHLRVQSAMSATSFSPGAQRLRLLSVGDRTTPPCARRGPGHGPNLAQPSAKMRTLWPNFGQYRPHQGSKKEKERDREPNLKIQKSRIKRVCVGHGTFSSLSLLLSLFHSLFPFPLFVCTCLCLCWHILGPS